MQIRPRSLFDRETVFYEAAAKHDAFYLKSILKEFMKDEEDDRSHDGEDSEQLEGCQQQPTLFRDSERTYNPKVLLY